MATKLKKMKLTSVDLVRAGANQEADICLFKSAEEREKDVEAAQDQHREEVSGYHDALMASVRSIQEDKDLDEETRQDLLQETWEQYCNAMAEVLGFEFEGEDLEPEPEAEPEEPDFDEIEEVEKFNHNHGPDGKFAPSGGGGGGGGLNAKVKGLMSQQYGGYDVPKLVDQMKVGDRVKVHNHKKNEDYEFEKLSDKNTISAFQNVNGKNHMASPDHVKGWVLDDVLNGGTPSFVEKSLDTIEEVQKFNPFHDALGRFASSSGFSTYSANPKSKAGAAAINRSAVAGHTSTMNVHRESKGENVGQNYLWLQGKPFGTPAALLQQQQQQASAAPPKPQKNVDARGFADSDSAGYHQLYAGKQYYAQQKLTATEQAATKSYLQATTEPGSLYSHSQNLNYRLAQANGDPNVLPPKYRQTYNGMMSSMHNLGYNVNLTRYDHANGVNAMLSKMGKTQGYEHMTQAALKKALVGQSVSEDKFVSTSYNDFSNVPRSSSSVFDSRAVKINYKAPAHTQAMMPGKGPGGDFGEIVLAPGQSGRIIDVRFTGQMVRRQGTQTYNQPRIEIDVELD